MVHLSTAPIWVSVKAKLLRFEEESFLEIKLSIITHVSSCFQFRIIFH